MSETIERTATDTAPAPRPWARTPRLALREFADADHDELIAMHREPRLREHLIDDYPLHQPAVARLFLQRIAQLYRVHEGLGIWHATRLQPEPRFAGWFSLMPMAGHEGQVEIGARLLPHAWGLGLAMEGCEQLLTHAFHTLHRSHVWGVCHPANRSAQAVLRALGFEAMGLANYDGHHASHWRLDAHVWQAPDTTPRRLKLRRALRPQPPHGEARA
jgi:RimJ/RimL family protein N-acetyltransferase